MNGIVLRYDTAAMLGTDTIIHIVEFFVELRSSPPWKIRIFSTFRPEDSGFTKILWSKSSYYISKYPIFKAKLDRCDRHRNRLNPSPNKLSADFICRRSKLFRVESLDKGYSDCLYCPDKSAFQQTASGYFRPFNNRNNSVVRNYPDFQYL